MSKTAQYAKIGAIVGGIGNALFNAFKQHEEIETNPLQKFDWERLVLSGLKGAAVGGGTGALIGGVCDHQNSQVKPINTDTLIYSMIARLELNKNDRPYRRLSDKAAFVEQLLTSYYAVLLKRPLERFGSTEKGTALNASFDIDIIMNFKPRSFPTLEEMYYDVFSFLRNNLRDDEIIEIRQQSKSIGIVYNMFGKEYRVEIVPNRVIDSRGNKTAGFLYKTNTALLTDNSSRVKTDVVALKSVPLTPAQKKIVVVLKNWKVKNEVPLSSHLLEHLVLDAYDRNIGCIPRKISDKVVMVLRHIYDRLDIAVIRSVENSNNVLTNISDEKKDKIISACKMVIQEYEYQPNSLVESLT